MDFVDIVLIALGLAMDAFAVSLAASGTGKINNRWAIFRLSFLFGFFQFMMPVLGWFAGVNLDPKALVVIDLVVADGRSVDFIQVDAVVPPRHVIAADGAGVHIVPGQRIRSAARVVARELDGLDGRILNTRRWCSTGAMQFDT